MSNVDYGQPQFKNLKYCTRCCMPETQEGIEFDEMGICRACQSSEQKIHIDWAAREKELKKILMQAKSSSGSNYDCIVPISGGKDSTFQLHTLVNVYGMKPLAVTFSHNWFSKTGWYNLMNCLEKFNVDHVMFTPNRGLVNRLAKKSLDEIGDPCWHCHSGCGAFPLSIAVKYKIPLLVWGESVAESSGRDSYAKRICIFDKDYFTKVSAKLTPKQMVCDYLTEKDLFPFELPTLEEIQNVGVVGIHLGDYIFWDEERQTEFVRDTYGWKERSIEGTYKRYKSAECSQAGLHDFTCYLKRGFGRGSFHASLDIRNGLLTREEGFELAKKHDLVRPKALDYFLNKTKMSEKEFFNVMEKHKNPKLKDADIFYTAEGNSDSKEVTPVVEQLIEKFETGDESL